MLREVVCEARGVPVGCVASKVSVTGEAMLDVFGTTICEVVLVISGNNRDSDVVEVEQEVEVPSSADV